MEHSCCSPINCLPIHRHLHQCFYEAPLPNEKHQSKMLSNCTQRTGSRSPYSNRLRKLLNLFTPHYKKKWKTLNPVSYRVAQNTLMSLHHTTTQLFNKHVLASCKQMTTRSQTKWLTIKGSRCWSWADGLKLRGSKVLCTSLFQKDDIWTWHPFATWLIFTYLGSY